MQAEKTVEQELAAGSSPISGWLFSNVCVCAEYEVGLLISKD
jgi:hypothetical protein